MKTYNTIAIETEIKGVDSNDELTALFARALELCQTPKPSQETSSPSSSNVQNLSSENITYCIQHAESVDLQPIPLPATNFQEYIQNMQNVSSQIEHKNEAGMKRALNSVYTTVDDDKLEGKDISDDPDNHLTTCSTKGQVKVSENDFTVKIEEDISEEMSTQDKSPFVKSQILVDKAIKTPVKHTKPKLHCTHCGKTYTSQGPFRKHLAKHEVKCLQDSVGDNNQETVQDETQSTSCEKPVPEHQYQVNQHNTNQENDKHTQTSTDERTDKCKFCLKIFTNNYEFVRHLQMHSGEKVHKCDVCEKAFTRKWYLAEHLRTHTGERPHKCELCNVAFVNKANLNKHLQIHSGVRQHKCGFCEKAFMRKHDIIRHLRIHTGERPFKCEHCDKAFMIKQHLVEHLRRHTGERPHKCGYCDMAFVTKGCLNKHIKTHTGERTLKR